MSIASWGMQNAAPGWMLSDTGKIFGSSLPDQRVVKQEKVAVIRYESRLQATFCLRKYYSHGCRLEADIF